ncbi:Parvalbumin beta-like [Pleodorina starrii]|uniref:Parvalbumin beta-like n=1 Tax=Pleodorina starrii TaxID=330485 RepID=A0A9W6BEN6_9CHLO|nr:Parvalbumin beta-like [Pleodorina starrii]GLC50658.1 Parvalbumin beta-like [Pleodorina starrii]GLC75272.1 Parvalbumin beta-like [Pleodorina starrii]
MATVASIERKEALLEVFKLIDASNEGFIDLEEVKALATDPATQAKLEEAREAIAWLNLSGDKLVSPDEFAEVFLFMGAGLDEREFELFVEDMKVHAGGTTTREMMLKRVFNSLDRDHSGFIEMHELKTLVGCVAPAESLERARGTLRMFDTNADERVSMDEFLTVFMFLAQDMSEPEFSAFLSQLAEKGFEALYEGDYRHPHGCRAWLQTEVMPTLRQGLLELMREVESDVLDLATGVPWDNGEHMPRGWRPFSPLRWLSQWLLAAATGGRPHTTEQGGEGEGLEGAGLVPVKNLEAMTREEKVVYLFNQIDVNGSGSIPASHLVSMVELIFADGAGGVRDARSTLIDPAMAALGVHSREGSVELDQFQQALAQMTSMLSDGEFDEAARVVAAQRDWRYCRSRADKFRYLFHSLDLDHSGSLNFNELKLLAQRMEPDTSEETIAATLEYMDRDGSDSVSVEEFVEALGALLSHVDSETELDDMVQRMLHMRGGVDPANEVEPPPLAAFVRALRTHLVAAQLPTSTVMDKLTGRQPLVLLDVRPEEERDVSIMPGAVPITLQPAPAATWGYALAGGPGTAAALIREALAATSAAALPSAQPPVVAAYCATGELGGVAALLLSEALRITVYNVCGGIINYYNQGGSVCRAADGKQVQALHPGSAPQQRAFVTRPNSYR